MSTIFTSFTLSLSFNMNVPPTLKFMISYSLIGTHLHISTQRGERDRDRERELNSVPLKEQQTLLTAKSSIQPRCWGVVVVITVFPVGSVVVVVVIITAALSQVDSVAHPCKQVL